MGLVLRSMRKTYLRRQVISPSQIGLFSPRRGLSASPLWFILVWRSSIESTLLRRPPYSHSLFPTSCGRLLLGSFLLLSRPVPLRARPHANCLPVPVRCTFSFIILFCYLPSPLILYYPLTALYLIMNRSCQVEWSALFPLVSPGLFRESAAVRTITLFSFSVLDHYHLLSSRFRIRRTFFPLVCSPTCIRCPNPAVVFESANPAPC